MRRRSLVDAGPLVALFDKNEHEHPRIVEYFRGFDGQLNSTLAVFTEVVYLLDFSHKAQQDFMRWAFGGAVKRIELTDDDGQRLLELHAKYADRPMDFADATLVAVGERLGIRDVLTLDGDFRIYRFRNAETFRLPLLDE